jgi:hypothetical protein
VSALEHSWSDPPGLKGWLSTVDHKRVARRYIFTTLVFFALAGLMGATIRVQLAQADNDLVGPDLYNQLFSMHGSAMMFLFAVPVMEAVALYLIPLMVGTRNVAFPRLNAYGYWVFLFGGLMSFTVFFMDIGPEAGWFSYVPLAGPAYSPGKRQDFWAQLVTFTELAALIGAIQIITTTFKLRAPGMTLARMPLFVWAMVATAFMIMFAMPSVMLASTFLITDRLVSTQFFNPAEGGDVLLWQHLFWFFGHPEVYIIFVPALGMISEILPVFARRRVVGYVALVIALVTIAFLSFGLWVHHMFTTGLPPLGMSFFTAASIMIALPTGLQIFCWIATLATGARDALAVRDRILLHLHHRRTDGHHAGLAHAGPAAARQLLRRRAPALRADRRRGVPAVRGVLLLVSQAHGADVVGTGRALELLAVLHRFQCRVLSHAHPRTRGHAAAHVHLSRGKWLGRAEPAVHRGGVRHRNQHGPVRHQRDRELAPRCARR